MAVSARPPSAGTPDFLIEARSSTQIYPHMPVHTLTSLVIVEKAVPDCLPFTPRLAFK